MKELGRKRRNCGVLCATVNEVVWEDLAEEKALKQRAEEGETVCQHVLGLKCKCKECPILVNRMFCFS